jgi:glycine dehydrogenase
MNFNFETRHIGPSQNDIDEMLANFKIKSLDDFTDKVIPETILAKSEFKKVEPLSEFHFLKKAQILGDKNKNLNSYIGQGYYNTNTPTVILRNIFESPAWYTSYTPYQAEISQGRLEALLNFQTMVTDLTGMQIANASLLDEGTAAAEAVSLALAVTKKKAAKKIVCDENLFKQTLDVIKTRAEAIDLEIVVADLTKWKSSGDEELCIITQYPNALGQIIDPTTMVSEAHQNGTITICCTDLLALTQIKPPGEMGFDIVVGSAQRLGVPMGFGGPHAAFFATRDEYKRSMPGRIIGVSKDRLGHTAFRMSLQTREQHIRRDKATSNICTAQALLAIMASMYAVYHGPKGLKYISDRILTYAENIKKEITALGYRCLSETSFDTLSFIDGPWTADQVISKFLESGINLGRWKQGWQFSVDESWTDETYQNFINILKGESKVVTGSMPLNLKLAKGELKNLKLVRSSSFLDHEIFNRMHSETEMLRYIYKLQNKDISLTHSMIPLGSCTMKLNATSEMIPVSDFRWSNYHPFIPTNQHQGYTEMINILEDRLKDITGFSAISFQPNAGSQGEYAGLLVIKKYFEDTNQSHRNICLIPSSAHGTNPASAVMANFKVVVVKCDDNGNVDLTDLQEKCIQHKDHLAALMITYPSTHGVFESEIKNICSMIHESGGQVYLDGANLNALVGIVKPAELGADVAHMNLHKTFCIPHGGGGPGVGPIGVAEHLVKYLPSHVIKKEANEDPQAIGAVSSAPWGSASILPISWAYIEMMGSEGLKKATQVAILNANYIAHRLKPYYKVLYTGKNGFVAHECIIDVRPFKTTAHVTVDDFAKRLMDYGFHAPTMSWPVSGTLMIEPTESESKVELDRFCEAMISIHNEIKKIESGEYNMDNNPMNQAPHTMGEISSDDWSHPYSRKAAAFPMEKGASIKPNNKFWPSVARIDNAFGDRTLVCSCPPLEDYQ